MKILCMGHSTYDVTLPVNSFPLENTKNRMDYDIVECGGGSASNSAYLLAKWNCDVTFASIIGDDYYGKLIKDEFKNIGVNIDYLDIDPMVKTTTSIIIANTSNGTRTILTDKDDCVASNNFIKDKFDVVMVDGYDLNREMNALINNKSAIKIIDAGSYRKEIVELGKYVDYFVCSNNFAKDYTKIQFKYDDIDSLTRVYDILERDFKNIVVITLEGDGCFTKIDNKYTKINSIQVKAVDSTGAGDIFHGAFTYFISEGYDLYKALVLSNITGALSVTKIGGRYSIPSINDVMKEYLKYEK